MSSKAWTHRCPYQLLEQLAEAQPNQAAMVRHYVAVVFCTVAVFVQAFPVQHSLLLLLASMSVSKSACSLAAKLQHASLHHKQHQQPGLAAHLAALTLSVASITAWLCYQSTHVCKTEQKSKDNQSNDSRRIALSAFLIAWRAHLCNICAPSDTELPDEWL